MVQHTNDAIVQFEQRQAAGYKLTDDERIGLQEAYEALKHTTRIEERNVERKDNVERRAKHYLNQLSDTVEVSYMNALEILRLWPGTTTAYDCMSSQTLLKQGNLPTLLPLKQERRSESFFGLTKGRIGSHAIMSRETYDYLRRMICRIYALRPLFMFGYDFVHYRLNFVHDWLDDFCGRRILHFGGRYIVC